MLKFSDFIEKDFCKVGVISGRFQPVTKAHISIIEKIAKENDRGIVFLVKGKASSKDKDRNPFDEEIQLRMLRNVIPENVEIKVIPTGFFIDELNESHYNNFILYTGSDRAESYRKQASYLNEDKKIEVIEIERTEEDISATKVRESLANEDEEAFKELTDDRIHYMFEDLKSYIKS